eukprot:scaffold11983_cov15-Tisochrysis_lutea.AAC.1
MSILRRVVPVMCSCFVQVADARPNPGSDDEDDEEENPEKTKKEEKKSDFVAQWVKTITNLVGAVLPVVAIAAVAATVVL